MSAIKKIVIFGASGNTGLATVSKAVDKGIVILISTSICKFSYKCLSLF